MKWTSADITKSLFIEADVVIIEKRRIKKWNFILAIRLGLDLLKKCP